MRAENSREVQKPPQRDTSLSMLQTTSRGPFSSRPFTLLPGPRSRMPVKGQRQGATPPLATSHDPETSTVGTMHISAALISRYSFQTRSDILGPSVLIGLPPEPDQFQLRVAWHCHRINILGDVCHDPGVWKIASENDVSRRLDEPKMADHEDDFGIKSLQVLCERDDCRRMAA